jgi:hypothetical protein
VHPLIEEMVDEIVGLSEEYNCDLSFKELGHDGFLISNQSIHRVAALGIVHVKDELGVTQKIVGAFSINVRKYAWAEAEGFTQQQMIDEMHDEIFSLIGTDEVFDYLCDKDFSP